MEFQSSVTDFDLNLLAPPPRNIFVPDKASKKSSLERLKSRVIGTNNLINKYYSNKECLAETKKLLLESQEEYSNIFTDYRNSLQKVSQLQSQIEELQNVNKLLEERCFNAETHYGGLQSHNKQLQVLVTEYEDEIKQLKSQMKFKKSLTPSQQDKQMTMLSKENIIMKKQICTLINVIQKKKKVSQSIKSIFEKYKDENSEDKETLKLDSSREDDLEDVPSVFYSEDSIDTLIIPPNSNITASLVSNNALTLRNDSVETEINDGRSVDTGRGSSLAYSDVEKNLHSPDYYMDDSPLSAEIVQNNDNAKSYRDGATSPIFKSPKYRDNFTSPMSKNTRCRDCSTSPMPIHRKSVATSPIMFDRNTVYIIHDPVEKIERGVSPIKILESCNQKTNKVVKEYRDAAVDTISLGINNNKKYNIRQERECLERNNSVIFSKENQNDPEVEMILSEMKLHQQLITPIPSTPILTNRVQRNSNSRIDESIFDVSGLDGVAIFKKLDAVYDLVYSMKERLPLFLNDSVNNNNTSESNNLEISTDKNIKQTLKVPSHTTQSEKLISTKNSITFEEIEISENNIINCDSALISDVDTPKQQISETEIIDKGHNYDLMISDDIESDNRSQSDIEDPIILEPLKQFNKENVLLLEKPTKPLVRKFKKKLTGLDKIRRRFTPKAKIKQQVPVKKLRFKPKKLEVPKKVTESDTAVSLNNKDVYEKAVKIMAELKSSKKIPTIIVEDCTKTLNSYILSPQKETSSNNSTKSPEVNSQKSLENDKMYSPNNSADLVSTERRKSVKRVTVSEFESESKRVLRPRRKSNVSITDNTSTPKDNSAAKDINNSEYYNTDTSELICVTPVKRRRLRKLLSSDESINSKNSSKESDNIKSPSKGNSVSTVSEITSPSQRILRSSVRQENELDKKVSAEANKSVIDNNCNVANRRINKISSCEISKRKKSSEELETTNTKENLTNNVKSKTQINYSDLDIFSADANGPQAKPTRSTNMDQTDKKINPKESILCSMIEKYGLMTVNFYGNKPSESVICAICDKLEKDIGRINELNAPENKRAMMKLVTYIQQLDIKDFIVGFMKYLKEPNRKTEMFNIIVSPPAPPMTKTEQVLLFVIAELRSHWRGADLVNDILDNIEYLLFNLNRSPDFHTIESMAHFYAVLCRYYKMKSRLRLFVMDSLYCLQFKAVPLIKQCLEVWMHILPLAHMGIAKIPLVTCLVYLLHFYKCEDKFNRVQELRMILKRKYFYHITEWNETKLLEMFKTAIKDLRGFPEEMKMLRLALIILGKRQGPKWCLKNIIKGILQPMIDNDESPHHVRMFCISMLGPLLKPFPNDMKVHCEVVVSKLMDMLDKKPPQDTAETIYTTLIYFSKHNEMRLNRYLLNWKPSKISSEFEEVLQDYVQSKPVKAWKNLLKKCLSSE